MTIDKGNSAIEFRLDPDSGVPTYLQLVQQVEHALRLGYLQPGDQLPKVRDVVTALTINPNTVLKAYRELEHKGLAAGRPGQGTFVQATLEQVTLPELAGLRRTLLGWLASAAQAGLDEDGVVALFTSGLRGFFTTRARRTTERRASHERDRDQRSWQALRQIVGAAGLHTDRARRAPGRARRPERRREVHADEHDGRPDRPDLGDRDGPRRGPGGLARRAQRRRVRRPGRTGLQEPVRRGHAAPHQEPEPALRHRVRAGAPDRPRHPAEQEGGQALRRPAVTASAHARAGPTAAAAHPG